MARTVFEFLFHYLADESLRNAVFFEDLTGMVTKFGLKQGDAITLRKLIEGDIFALLKSDLDALHQKNGTQEIVDTMKAVLKEVGFDAVKANKAVWNSTPDCVPPQNLPPALIAPMGAAAYGEGEVHVRCVRPKIAHVGQSVPVDISGQGFGPGVAVRFVHTSGSIRPATIVNEHADVDVHQYLTVDVTFDQIGFWAVQVFNDHANVWADPVCGIEAI